MRTLWLCDICDKQYQPEITRYALRLTKYANTFDTFGHHICELAICPECLPDEAWGEVRPKLWARILKIFGKFRYYK